MLRRFAHHHQVGIERGQQVLASEDHPCEHIEPLPIPDDQAARDAAMQAIRWVLDAIGSGGILAKVLALRYVFRMEHQSMDKLAGEYGMCRANISKWVTTFSDQRGVPALKSHKARGHYSRTQLKVWDTRPRHHAPRLKEREQ